MHTQFFNLMTVVGCILPTITSAALVIEIDPASVQRDSVNNPANLNIFVRSNSGPIDVALFTFRLDLVDVSIAQGGMPATGTVFFSTTQPNQAQSDPNYIFNPLQRADNYETGSQGFQTPDGNGSLAISIGDSTFDVDQGTYSNITVDNDRLLLGQINLYQSQPAGTSGTPFGIYRVDLSFDPLNTFFSNGADFEPIAFQQGSSGFVTLAPSAVPEPSSLLLCGVGLAYSIRRRLSRRLSQRAIVSEL